MGEESAAVTGLAAEGAQVILQRGEWTDRARDLHPESPRECGQVYQRRTAPAPGEKAAENDERGEGEVDDDQTVGEQRPDHWPRCVPASGSVDARNENACDTVQRLLQDRHAAGERQAHVAGRAETGAGNHRDTRLVQEKLRESAVVAAAERADRARYVRKRVEGARARQAAHARQ